MNFVYFLPAFYNSNPGYGCRCQLPLRGFYSNGIGSTSDMFHTSCHVGLLWCITTSGSGKPDKAQYDIAAIFPEVQLYKQFILLGYIDQWFVHDI